MAAIHKFSHRSIGYLNQCEPVLKEFAIRTLKHCPSDLSVLSSTIRSLEKQKEYVANGTSKTMNSMHLPGKNGLSRAVDLAPYVKGVSPWKLPSSWFEDIHVAGQLAAREMNLNVRSGICWTNLNQKMSLDDLLWQYRNAKRDAGGRPFFDGPHFELYRAEYP